MNKEGEAEEPKKKSGEVPQGIDTMETQIMEEPESQAWSPSPVHAMQSLDLSPGMALPSKLCRGKSKSFLGSQPSGDIVTLDESDDGGCEDQDDGSEAELCLKGDSVEVFQDNDTVQICDSDDECLMSPPRPKGEERRAEEEKPVAEAPPTHAPVLKPKEEPNEQDPPIEQTCKEKPKEVIQTPHREVVAGQSERKVKPEIEESKEHVEPKIEETKEPVGEPFKEDIPLPADKALESKREMEALAAVEEQVDSETEGGKKAKKNTFKDGVLFGYGFVLVHKH